MNKPGRKRKIHLPGVAVILLIILLAPIIIAAVLLWLLYGFILQVLAWCLWCTRGRRVLFVYSDSPIWHDYIEQRILPRVGNKAVLLNWSQHKRWKITLATLVFLHYSGYRAFNPMAIVFRPLWFTRKLRFYQPFLDYKHGKPEKVAEMEQTLFQLLKV
jgi:hypothetical protein